MIVIETKIREIEVDGFKVEIHKFGKKQFYYPSFNGNAEFEVNSKGFKLLRRYLRSVKYYKERLDTVFI